MKNRILLFLFIALFLPTLLWASDERQPLDKIVAIVNDSVVTERELKEKVQLFQQQIAAQQGVMPTEAALREQVLQQLINIDLQLQVAGIINITIDDQQVGEALKEIAEKNQVSLEVMRREIEAEGMSFQDYQENLRKEMIISQVQQQMVAQDVVITEHQVSDYLQTFKEELKANQAYHVRHIHLPLSESPDPNDLGEAELKAERIMQRLRRGEDFSEVAYAESYGGSALRGGDLGWRQLAGLPDVFAEVVVTMEVGEVKGPVRAANGLHVIKLEAVRGGPEQIQHFTHARHILLQPGDELSSAQARQQLLSLRDSILAGEADFASLAKAHSQDPGSAEQGGDLGWVTLAELVPPFAEAMDGVAIGDISQPVMTQFGWHIVQVLDRKTENNPEKQLRDQTRRLLYHRKYEEAVENWLMQLRDQGYIEILEEVG